MKYFKAYHVNLFYILRCGVLSSLCTHYTCLDFQMGPNNVLIIKYHHNRHPMGQFALKDAYWCVEGEVIQPENKWIAWQGGLLEGTVGRRKLCMVPCRSCNIYETWRTGEGGRGLKSSYGGKPQRGGQISIGGIDPSRHHVVCTKLSMVVS